MITMLHHNNDEIPYFYEPFLWKSEYCIGNLDGLRAHKALPLFINKAMAEDLYSKYFRPNSFNRQINRTKLNVLLSAKYMGILRKIHRLYVKYSLDKKITKDLELELALALNYISSITSCQDWLTKIVRGVGRVDLFDLFTSDIKYIFVIRKPMGTINSISNVPFSFLETPIAHKGSDWNRFRLEVKELKQPYGNIIEKLFTNADDHLLDIFPK